jgi:hypothetical protein
LIEINSFLSLNRLPLCLLAPEVSDTVGRYDKYAERTDAALDRVVPAACTVVGEFRRASCTASLRLIECATESAPA